MLPPPAIVGGAFSKNYETWSFFIKVAYQQSNSINSAIKQNIMSDQGLVIPFPYISNFSFNDTANALAHTVNLSVRIYNLIGNKLRRIYLIPSSLANTAANLPAGNVVIPTGSSPLNNCTNIQFFIDSNLITQYDNTRYENLLNCKLSSKYWNKDLQTFNFFLPVYFYDNDKDNDNLNEGLNVNSDSIFSFNCTVGANANNPSSSFDLFAEGVKNLIISRNGVAVV